MRKVLVSIASVFLSVAGVISLFLIFKEYAKSNIREDVKESIIKSFEEGETDFDVPSDDRLAIAGEDGDDSDQELFLSWIKIAEYKQSRGGEYDSLHLAGIIEIPDLDIEEPVWEENTSLAMRYGVILMDFSAGLDEPGNSIIVGHRNTVTHTVFDSLVDIDENSRVIIISSDGTRNEYRVDSTDYCSPYELQDYVSGISGSSKTITLVTCAREYGNCWRFVVTLLPATES